MSYTPYPTAHISFSAILHIFFSPFHHRLTQAIFFISHTHAAVFCPWNLHLFCPRSPSPCVPLVMISSPQSSAVGATPRLPHPSGYCLSFCLRLPFREILTHSFPRSFKHLVETCISAELWQCAPFLGWTKAPPRHTQTTRIIRASAGWQDAWCCTWLA